MAEIAAAGEKERDQLNRQAEILQSAILRTKNEQLGRSVDAMAMVIAALSALFAVGAIFAGLVLFAQSRDYNQRLKASLDALADARRVFDDMVRKGTEKLNVLDAEITEARRRRGAAEGEERDTLAARVASLEAERSWLQRAVGTQLAGFDQYENPLWSSLVARDVSERQRRQTAAAAAAQTPAGGAEPD